MFVFLFSCSSAFQQSGCTDSLADNYDEDALENDGSCRYSITSVAVSKSFPLDDVLSGTSGVIFYDGVLWTHNDHYDPVIYKIHPDNGNIAGNFSIDPYQPVDWEDIAQDDDFFYLGDFGNNTSGDRGDLRILKLDKQAMTEGRIQLDTISFTYDKQLSLIKEGPNKTNFDCEAFIVFEDSIYLFTKEWSSNTTSIYKLPTTPGSYQAEFQDNFNSNGLITGANYFKPSGTIALVGYNMLMQPFVILLTDFEEDEFFSGNKRKIQIELPFHQVEAIATADGHTYYITNEKFDTTGTVQQLHLLDLSPFIPK